MEAVEKIWTAGDGSYPEDLLRVLGRRDLISISSLYPDTADEDQAIQPMKIRQEPLSPSRAARLRHPLPPGAL